MKIFCWKCQWKIFVNLLRRRGCYLHSIWMDQSDYFSLMQGIVDCLCCTWAQLFLIIKHTDKVLCMIDHIIISFFITGNIRRVWNNNRIVCVLDQLFQSMFTLIRPFRVIADEGNYNDNFNIKWLIISKKPWFTGIQAGFQTEFTTNLLLLRERALICRPEPCKPKHQHTALRKNKWKLNTTQTRRFSIPIPGEQERRFFYALMLRSRGEKSLAICGFAGALLPGTGIYT